MTTPSQHGLAYGAPVNGRVRGTLGGRYAVVPEGTAAEIEHRLRAEFAAGRGQPIPAGGYPPMTDDVTGRG